jgi:hypothetical protein
MPLDKENTRAQLAAYAEAARLDPGFAKALVAEAFVGASATHDAGGRGASWVTLVACHCARFILPLLSMISR